MAGNKSSNRGYVNSNSKKRQSSVSHRKKSASREKARPSAPRYRSRTLDIDEYRRMKTRSRSRMLTVMIVTSLFFICVLAYIINAVVKFVNKPNISSETIMIGTKDFPDIIDGIIIRDESVYNSTANGIVSYNVNDMDKIKKGSIVCTVSNAAAVARIANDKLALEKSLLNLQNRRQDLSDFSREAQTVNKQIKDMVDKNTFSFAGNDITQVHDFKENINQNINIRNQMLLSEGMGSARELVNDNKLYDKELSGNVSYIYAAEGGIVYTTVDGMEERLTPKSMFDLRSDETRMKIDYNTLVSKRDVASGDSIFKIIKSNDWYIAVYIPASLSYNWSENDSMVIYIEKNKDKNEQFVPLNVTISSLTKGDKENFVIFQCTKNILDFIDMRNVKIKLTNTVQKGLKIPNSAIVEKVMLKIPLSFVYEPEYAKDKMIGGIEPKLVIKKGSGFNESILIYPQDSDNDFVYILRDYNTLKQDDIICRNDSPDDVYVLDEIINVKGVFLINDGTARFRRITLDSGILDSEGYSILDPAKNRLKVYDRIITDAKFITDGQSVY